MIGGCDGGLPPSECANEAVDLLGYRRHHMAWRAVMDDICICPQGVSTSISDSTHTHTYTQRGFRGPQGALI